MENQQVNKYETKYTNTQNEELKMNSSEFLAIYPKFDWFLNPIDEQLTNRKMDSLIYRCCDLKTVDIYDLYDDLKINQDGTFKKSYNDQEVEKIFTELIKCHQEYLNIKSEFIDKEITKKGILEITSLLAIEGYNNNLENIIYMFMKAYKHINFYDIIEGFFLDGHIDIDYFNDVLKRLKMKKVIYLRSNTKTNKLVADILAYKIPKHIILVK